MEIDFEDNTTFLETKITKIIYKLRLQKLKKGELIRMLKNISLQFLFNEEYIKFKITETQKIISVPNSQDISIITNIIHFALDKLIDEHGEILDHYDVSNPYRNTTYNIFKKFSDCYNETVKELKSNPDFIKQPNDQIVKEIVKLFFQKIKEKKNVIDGFLESFSYILDTIVKDKEQNDLDMERITHGRNLNSDTIHFRSESERPGTPIDNLEYAN